MGGSTTRILQSTGCHALATRLRSRLSCWTARTFRRRARAKPGWWDWLRRWAMPFSPRRATGCAACLWRRRTAKLLKWGRLVRVSQSHSREKNRLGYRTGGVDGNNFRYNSMIWMMLLPILRAPEWLQMRFEWRLNGAFGLVLRAARRRSGGPALEHFSIGVSSQGLKPNRFL